MSRSLTMASIASSPILAKIWVSEPVGSSTETFAGKPSGAILDMLGTDAVDHRLAARRVDPAAGSTDPVSDMKICLPSSVSILPLMKFIAGEPMKPATKMLAGLS